MLSPRRLLLFEGWIWEGLEVGRISAGGLEVRTCAVKEKQESEDCGLVRKNGGFVSELKMELQVCGRWYEIVRKAHHLM